MRKVNLKVMLAVLAFILFCSPAFAITRFGNGTKTITSAGSALALTSTSTDVTTLVVCGDSGNTGPIAVGASPVAASGSQQGFIVAAGSCAGIYTSIDHNPFDISTIKADVTTSGNKVSYFWVNEIQ